MAFLSEQSVTKSGYRFDIGTEQVSVFKGDTRLGELLIEDRKGTRARYGFFNVSGKKHYHNYHSPVVAARQLEEEVTNGPKRFAESQAIDRYYQAKYQRIRELIKTPVPEELTIDCFRFQVKSEINTFLEGDFNKDRFKPLEFSRVSEVRKFGESFGIGQAISYVGGNEFFPYVHYGFDNSHQTTFEKAVQVMWAYHNLQSCRMYRSLSETSWVIFDATQNGVPMNSPEMFKLVAGFKPILVEPYSIYQRFHDPNYEEEFRFVTTESTFEAAERRMDEIEERGHWSERKPILVIANTGQVVAHSGTTSQIWRHY